MGQSTGIAWTEHTFNPWWGCIEVSAECIECYARVLALKAGFDLWGPNKARRVFGPKHWQEPLKWNEEAKREGRRHRVFCASMADVFEDYNGPTDLHAERTKLWALIAATPWLDWQLLTKRPENFHGYLPAEWLRKPPSNVWLGVSAGGQQWADERIPILMELPFPVLWVSAEPLLGRVDFRKWLPGPGESTGRRCIDWIITGGESGEKARPCDLAWLLDIDAQCKAAKVPHFLKQLGSRPVAHVNILQELGLTPVHPLPGMAIPPDHRLLRFPGKADNPSTWPASFRVRQFPGDVRSHSRA